jgi:hypothetical protein
LCRSFVFINILALFPQKVAFSRHLSALSKAILGWRRPRRVGSAMSRRDRPSQAVQSDRTAPSAHHRRSDTTSAPVHPPMRSVRARRRSILAYKLGRNLPRNFPAVGCLSAPTPSLGVWRGRGHFGKIGSAAIHTKEAKEKR